MKRRYQKMEDVVEELQKLVKQQKAVNRRRTRRIRGWVLSLIGVMVLFAVLLFTGVIPGLRQSGDDPSQLAALTTSPTQDADATGLAEADQEGTPAPVVEETAGEGGDTPTAEDQVDLRRSPPAHQRRRRKPQRSL